MAADAAQEELTAAALALGGTITGEHGIGSEKRHQMAHRFRPAEIAAMRAVKAAFDPAGLLNPGMVLPEPSAEEPSLPRFAAAMREVVADRRHDRRWSPTSPDAQILPSEASAILVDANNRTVTVAAITPLGAVHDELARHGLETSLPNVSDTVGAVVTGDDTARGVVRNTLLAVHATLLDGSSVRFGGNTVKDVAGYDLKRLFTGSGDQFGTLIEVTLQVRARRHETARAPVGGSM
jgi:glycolate oxidase